MSEFTLSGLAENDLLDIWAFLAARNPEAADAVRDDIFDAIARVAKRPDLGHPRRDLTSRPLLFFPVRKTYLVVYDPTAKPISIARILHGARDVTEQLE